MKEIILTQGKAALVDDKDYIELSKFKWCAAKNRNTWYVVRQQWNEGKPKTIFMHRIILSAKTGQICDHINGNGLDNRRLNLRFATNNQNCWNSDSHMKGTSQFKGVRLNKRKKNNWSAAIKVYKKRIYLGTFKTEKEAAIAYNKAALQYHGEFAKINIIN